MNLVNNLLYTQGRPKKDAKDNNEEIISVNDNNDQETAKEKNSQKELTKEEAEEEQLLESDLKNDEQFQQELRVKIATNLNLKLYQVQNAINLYENENTTHFIARYRKEVTGNLDETQLRQIFEQKKQLEKIQKAKISALKNINEQGKLTEELKQQIMNAQTLTLVEDLYEPYKRKKKTKADIAIEKGFQSVATLIKLSRGSQNIEISKELLAKYPEDEILQGAKDIINQQISDSAEIKEIVRKHFKENGIIVSAFKKLEVDKKSTSAKENKEQKYKSQEVSSVFVEDQNEDFKKQKFSLKDEQQKFAIYETFQKQTNQLQGHQILALNRGEKLKVLDVDLEYNTKFFEKVAEEEVYLDYEYVKEGLKKVFQQVEREIRNELTEKAEIQAIEIFQQNLKRLLMLKPHYGEKILAIDPGFRTGCKMCLIDEHGNPSSFSKFYLIKPDEAKLQIEKILKSDYVIVVGNGSFSLQTQEFIQKNFPNNRMQVVDEDGCSVYSASEIAKEEFPNLDATDRGTISIGRKYIDSMSEIVKIPVLSMGVGMYQHDMNQKSLELKLSETVEDVVNLVGINLNTASPYLLSYVSGINKASAKKIFANRPYKSRSELEKLISKKAYQQSVGFLRVRESENIFDNTAIHPEQYDIAKKIIENEELTDQQIYTMLKKDFSDINTSTIHDIRQHYKNRNVEIRKLENNFNKTYRQMQNNKVVQENDKVVGVVKNITTFGAFIDIGMKSDGMLHISNVMKNKSVKVKNIFDHLSIGEQIVVKILTIKQTPQKTLYNLKFVKKVDDTNNTE